MDSSEYMVRSSTLSQIQPLTNRSPKRKFEETKDTTFTASITRTDQPQMANYAYRNMQDATSSQISTRWVCQTLFATLGAIAINAYRALCWSAKKSYIFVSSQRVIEIRSYAEDGHESVKRRSIEQVTQPTDRKSHPLSRAHSHMTSTTASHLPTHLEQIAYAFANNTGQNLQNNATGDIFNLSRRSAHSMYSSFQTPYVPVCAMGGSEHDTVEPNGHHPPMPGTTIASYNQSTNKSGMKPKDKPLESATVGCKKIHRMPGGFEDGFEDLSIISEPDTDVTVEGPSTVLYETSTIPEHPITAQEELPTQHEQSSPPQYLWNTTTEKTYIAKSNHIPGDIFAFEDSIDNEDNRVALQNHGTSVSSHIESVNIKTPQNQNIAVKPENDSEEIEANYARGSLIDGEALRTHQATIDNMWTPNDLPQQTYTDADLLIPSRAIKAVSTPVVPHFNSVSGNQVEQMGTIDRQTKILLRGQPQPTKFRQPISTPGPKSRHQKLSNEKEDAFSPSLVEDRSFDGPGYPRRERANKKVHPYHQTTYFTDSLTPEAQKAVFKNRRYPAHNPVKHARFSISPDTDQPTISTRVFDNTICELGISEYLENRQLPQKLEQTQYDLCLTDIAHIMRDGEARMRSSSPGLQRDHPNATNPNITVTLAATGENQDSNYVLYEPFDTSVEMTDAPPISTAQSLPISPQILSPSIADQTTTPIQLSSPYDLSDVEKTSQVQFPRSPERYTSAQSVSEVQNGSQTPLKLARSSSGESLSNAIDSMSISRDKSKERKERERKRREAKAAAEAEARRVAEEAAAAEAKRLAEEKAKAAGTRRMPSVPLITPITAEWENRLRREMQKPGATQIAKSAKNVALTVKDFATLLGPTSWLNDEIINAYLEEIVRYSNARTGSSGEGSIPKYVTHNSFFYKNLAGRGPSSVGRWMKKKNADGAKLLEVEQVFVPVNNASHWTIIILSPTRRTIEYLDSFGGSDTVFVSNIKKWLAHELGSAWKPEEWNVLQTRSAVQTNGYDCGVFAITNAKCVALGLDPTCYSGRDLAAQRRRVAAELMAGGFVGEFAPPLDL